MHTLPAKVVVIKPSACMRSEGYVLCPSVCVSTFITTGNEAARKWYTCLQRHKRSKNNVANLAKTAAFWQEKLAPPWTTFRDPTHHNFIAVRMHTSGKIISLK